MRARIVFRITWCVLTTVIVFLVTGALLNDLDEALGAQFVESVKWLARRGVPEVLHNAMYMLQQAVTFVVPFVLALFVFDRLVTRPDGYTRCGVCGEILERLPKARCPSCGHSI